MYSYTLDESHHGRPSVIVYVRDGGRGRPRIEIDHEFLRLAFPLRGVTGLARYLQCSVSVVRRALLDAGIVDPGDNPFPIPNGASNPTIEEGLPGALPLQPSNLTTLPEAHQPTMSNITEENRPTQASSFQATSSWVDDELDENVRLLRIHYPRAGIAMLEGMIRNLGHRIPRARIANSLTRVDPVKRVFQRIKIRRRKYTVPGPNSLWHHDGQHGE
jgi:hypothetical protein